jgi:hypothetical protein
MNLSNKIDPRLSDIPDEYYINDFRKLTTFTELDKRICFMAGTNLFLITCGDYVNKLVEIAKSEFKKLN